MILTVAAIGLLILGVAALAALGIFAVQKWGQPLAQQAIEAYWSGRWTDLVARVETLERDTEALPRTWEEFSKDAKRNKDRAHYHVRRVQKELEARGLSDGEIDALEGELRSADGEGGDGQGLLPLHDAMAKVPAVEADWRTQALNQKWGRR